jgi:restriction system protein
MVRAGEGGYLANDFEKSGLAAIGWDGDFTSIRTLQDMRAEMIRMYPEYSHAAMVNAAAMSFKFRQVMKPGDFVVTYDPQRREYLLGRIDGEYQYSPGLLPPYNHIRKVQWAGRVSRDALNTSSKNTLGSTLTVFEPGVDVLQDLQDALGHHAPGAPEQQPTEEPGNFELAREDAASRSHEFIKDRILKLSPDDMEVLTAAVLRAMGYKARVTPKGRDRGRDVEASPDGLGFLTPRIVAQVKHRRDPTGPEAIRAFIGVLQADDKALFVSTGGFTYDAKYEAERARVAITLVDLENLAQLVVEYYDRFDADGRSLLPLIRIYWPAS